MTQVDVLLPKWGLTMTEATIVAWLKNPGDDVRKDEALVEVETEKATAEVEAPADGTLAKLLHEPGAVVGVGEPLAVLQVAGEAAPAPREAAGPREPASESEGSEARKSAPVARPAPPPAPAAARTGRASPVARRVAAELGVELAGIEGTGSRWLITEADVRAAAAAGQTDPGASALAVARTEVLAGRRKAIGETLSRDLAASPQVTLTRAVDAGTIAALRAESAEEYSINDFLIAATASALSDHPALNAHLVDGELRYFDQVNIGLAVDLEGGLIVPVLRDVQRLSLDEIRHGRLALVETVRSGTIAPADLMDGTFTISNLGAWEIDAFTPIINPPQVSILGVGRLQERPAVVDGELRPRLEMVLSLTFDHRALDGRVAAEFLGALADVLGSRDALSSRLGQAK